MIFRRSFYEMWCHRDGRDKCEVRDRTYQESCERERQLRNIYLKSLGNIQGNTWYSSTNNGICYHDCTLRQRVTSLFISYVKLVFM